MSNQWYDHQQVEEKWLQVWEERKLFQGTAGVDATDPLFLLFAFAYPSGSGLHVGHVESKTALDILARHNRMQGKDVFFPVGWDAFGLPAENYAIKTGTPPSETTVSAINTFRRQIKRVGISYDWESEIATSHPGYYKWTQWIFLQLFEKGLAYQKEAAVNWCPSCQTVLANEQVVNGLCERCDSEVIQKEMKQWFFKISEYQDELISGLDTVDWPEPTKQQQLHWIGKKKGAIISFEIADTNAQVECFTTRIDTVFGVTFVVISPEKFEKLGLSEHLPADKSDVVAKYIASAFKKTEEQRQIGEKDKSGAETGLFAINPANGKKVPVLVADYVLGGYGTGAVMGVPAHDERDWAFAKKHTLEIIPVVVPTTGEAPENECYSVYGRLINSGDFNGISSEEAMTTIVDANPKTMRQETTYRLRDWLISRQRYWGAPIPVVYDPEGNAHPVKEEHLPWKLPTDVDFKPTGESPLESSEEFIARTEKLYGKGWRPEFDTMDTFVDSSWYFLRYGDARNEAEFASKSQIEKWLPVDMYMIGPEHIVLHLLYSRFFTKFLRDEGYLKFDEPFMKMRHQGMILGPDGKKMSKSKGNVINPDEVIEKFGADTLRVYEMFMGPLEADKPWDVRAVMGVFKFSQRISNAVAEHLRLTKIEPENANTDVQRKLHQTIKKVTKDIPELKFNTAIAAMMEFMNSWEDAQKAAHSATPIQQVLTTTDVISFIKILAPFAPFLAEELYHQLTNAGPEESVHEPDWPAFDPELATAETIEMGVQINGKVRDTLEIPVDVAADKAAVLAAAKALPGVQRYTDGKTIKKEIYVPGRIVSFVV